MSTTNLSIGSVAPAHGLAFVTCVSRIDVFERRLMASPCLQAGGYPVAAYWNCRSAAQAFNAAIAGGAGGAKWLVWVHQDVVLPLHWDRQFLAALNAAEALFPKLAVAGLYGLSGAGSGARRAGHVLDRGTLLQEPTTLPCLADSLDELLFAVKLGSGLLLDADLGFDFYATDLVLQAKHQGLQSVVVDAYCEHWSDTPASGAVAATVVQRIKQSAAVFERKWAHHMPISTPCFEISKPGDTAAFIDSIVSRLP